MEMMSVEKLLKNKTNWRDQVSIIIIGFITFVGDASRGILNPVLWPLCRLCGGDAVTLGYLVSTFSLGRLIITTEIGKYADTSKYKHQGALLLSGGVCLIGAFLWANIIQTGKHIEVLFLAQLLLGIGTGNLGVLRAYVAEKSSKEWKTQNLANLTALQYAGFAATPILGASLYIAGGHTNLKYSLPAYLVVLFTGICQCLLIYPFQNIKDDTSTGTDIINNVSTMNNEPMNNKSSDNQSQMQSSRLSAVSLNDDVNEIQLLIDENDYYCPKKQDSKDTIYRISECISEEIALKEKEKDLNRVYLLFIILNFTTRGVVSVYESQGTQILLDLYKLNEFQVGVIISIGGIIGTFNLLYFKEIWMKYFTYMQLMIGGLFITALAQLLLINWGPDTYHRFYLYGTSMFLVYGFGYPISNAAVLGLFSILIKKGSQGKAQGQFAWSGSLARIIVPFVVGYATQYLDSLSGFSINLTLMSVSIWGITYLYYKIMYYSGTVDIDESIDKFGSNYRNQKLTLKLYITMGISIFFAIQGLLSAADYFVEGW